MRKLSLLLSFLTAVLLVVLALLPAAAQTDIAGSIYGAFSGTTTGNGFQQSPANQAGGLIELRHIANPILGFEATYSFNRANETYQASVLLCPRIGCTSIESVSANAHEITADWIPSLHFANLRPFGVLGAGLLLDVPATSQATVYTQNCSACAVTTTTSPTQTSTKAV